MKKRRSKHYIEILPASLLPQRRAWQTLADRLPEEAWLLVLPKNNNEIRQAIFDLAQPLKKKGRRVVILHRTNGVTFRIYSP